MGFLGPLLVLIFIHQLRRHGFGNEGYESNEGRESYESNEGNEGSESHENDEEEGDEGEQDREGQKGEGVGTSWEQGEDFWRLEEGRPPEEQERPHRREEGFGGS